MGIQSGKNVVEKFVLRGQAFGRTLFTVAICSKSADKGSKVPIIEIAGSIID